MPWALAAAAVAAGGAIYSGRQASKAADKAAERAGETQVGSQAYQEAAMARARTGLQPYADQEAMGRNQMMRQLGLAGPQSMGGGGMIPMGGGQTAAAPQPQGTAGSDRSELYGDGNQPMSEEAVKQAYRDILGREADPGGLDYALHGGKRPKGEMNLLDPAGLFGGDDAERGAFTYNDWVSATRKGEEYKERQAAGTLPPGESGGQYSANFTGSAIDARYRDSFLNQFDPSQIPKAQFSTPQASTETQAMGGAPIPMGGGRYAPGDDQRLLAGTTASGAPIMDASGQPIEGEYLPAGGGVQTAGSVMGRAGVSGMPEGLEERYYTDIEEQAPQFGMDFKENPAYLAMQEENIRNIDSAAAGAGQLYSGRRGEALRDVSASTQASFYQDAADRERREYENRMGRRGRAVGAGQSRQDQYYSNYMNMLQNLAQPTTATNIASMETGGGQVIGAQMMGSQQRQSDYDLAGAGAQSTAFADAAGAIGQGVSSYMNRPQSGAPSQVEQMYGGGSF